MAKLKDREIMNDVYRADVIDALTRRGYNRKKLLQMSDDQLAYTYMAWQRQLEREIDYSSEEEEKAIRRMETIHNEFGDE